ncbi:MAG: relaxase [Phreatobacter sp.]|uniref:relaxase/mobilization nuclease domain-containing protein n=1 Tax=Phreatobacter sp. TaxID=1966341 RepID=UPI001A59AB5C|nr:relaxase [Phreatobacter sp.]MBL8567941.1 relaxase [Phreatobacter sp.]
MILQGSQRGGARQLAAHLLNDRDNDHVTVQELRGFASGDLFGAMAEVEAICKGTKAKQPVFSLSLNPPKNAVIDVATLVAAADRAEAALGLSGQPRAIVVHEKAGRRHAHVVWSRLDADTMTAINMPFFKTKLMGLAKELYLEHGWDLPDGYKTQGWKNPLNFTLAEWQQAQRTGLDPREIKQMFREAWEQSDGQASLAAALEDHGFYLARGDRRGVVAVDAHGEVYALARWTGLRTKDLAGKVKHPETLPDVAATKAKIQSLMSRQLRGFLREDREAKDRELKPLADRAKAIVASQRAERVRLDQGQRRRFDAEAKDRAGRFRTGLGALLDFLSGKSARIRRENEHDAYRGYLRDRAQREALFRDQAKERQALQVQLDRMRQRHRDERRQLARQLAAAWRGIGEERQQSQERTRQRGRGPGLEL